MHQTKFTYSWNLIIYTLTKKSKDTLPGIIQQRERLLKKYFEISFHDIFTHETFEWAVETNAIHYSKEFLDFLKDKVYPTCIPLQ